MKPRQITILIIFLSLSQYTFGQENYRERYTAYCNAHDTIAQRQVLEEWEKSSPNDPELFTSYFNYYFQRSKYNMLNIDSKPGGEDNLQIKDSTDQVMGFLVEKTYFKSELQDKGFEWINKGIKKYPSRLDMRFGKIYALGQSENWEGFTNEILQAIDYSKQINNTWIWTNNEPVEDPENFFLGSIQGYQNQLYNADEDSLLKNMRGISEQILKYYPNHVESLSNIAVTFLLTDQYNKALPPLLKAEKISPNDIIILSNIAYAYKLSEDKTNAIKYYEKLIEIGDEQTKQLAEQQIDLLKE